MTILPGSPFLMLYMSSKEQERPPAETETTLTGTQDQGFGGYNLDDVCCRVKVCLKPLYQCFVGV